MAAAPPPSDGEFASHIRDPVCRVRLPGRNGGANASAGHATWSFRVIGPSRNAHPRRYHQALTYHCAQLASPTPHSLGALRPYALSFAHLSLLFLLYQSLSNPP